MFFFLFSLICKSVTDSSTPFVVDKKHLIDKFQKFNELIKTRRFVSFKAVQNAQVCNDATPSHIPPLSEPKPYKWAAFDASKPLKFNFTHYTWFAFTGELDVPEGYDPSKHLVRFQFDVNVNWVGNSGDDDTPSGPEGRYWIYEDQIAAIDSFHNGAIIDWEKYKDTNKTIQMRIFTGRAKAEHTLTTYGIYLVHKDTEALYQRIRFLIDILKQLADDNVDKPQLLSVIDNAIRKLDIRELHYPLDLVDIRLQDKSYKAFYDSTTAALKSLKEGLSKMGKPLEDDPAISIVGYSHIDTMWLWPFNITHFKISNTATSMLYLMEHPPHDFENPVQWKFLATAPQHYKWMEEDSNPLFKRVVQKAKDGLWDVNGLMWLEPDTNNPSGESLVRQILYGVRYFEKNVGKEFNQTVLFLPDCFGFTASLPQILRLAEVDSFVTSKISWSEYTQFPFSTFKWRGIDGSFVNCHFITTPSGWGPAATYTGTSTARELLGTWTANKQNDLIRTSALHTSGNGDGGGGITEEMVWNFNIYQELPRIQNVPRLKFRNIEEVMQEVRNVSAHLPVWDDELYLEYHRGTYTSFEEIKRQNRQLETHLHNVEWLTTILMTLTSSAKSTKNDANIKYFHDAIQPIWEDTLLFHFHDSIPGSTINEGNVDAIQRGRPFLKLLRQLESELASNISDLIAGTEGELVFNTLSHDRYVHDQLIPSGGWALKKEATRILIDEDNTSIYERTFDDGYKEHVLHEPFVQTSYPPSNSNRVIVDASRGQVETPFFTVVFNDKDGSILSVVDKHTGIEYLDQESPSNVFELYEDRSIQYAAWDIQYYHKEMQIDPPVFSGIEYTDKSVITKFYIPRIGNGDGDCKNTTIEQTITFSPNQPFIDFRTLVHWTQHDKLLKVAFPTNIRSREGRFGIQFGNILRPTHNNTERDMAKFETFGRWAELGEQERGVTLMSDVKSGFDVHESTIRMSLLKAPMQEDRWEDFGNRKFTYRAVFHNTSYSNAKIQNLHDDLITSPVVKSASKVSGKIDAETRFVEVSDDNVIVDTLKVAEEAVEKDQTNFIVRIYESSGTYRKATVKFNLLDESMWEDPIVVNLLEKPFIGNAQVIKKLKNGQLSFTIALKPFEVKSLLIKRKV